MAHRDWHALRGFGEPLRRMGCFRCFPAHEHPSLCLIWRAERRRFVRVCRQKRWHSALASPYAPSTRPRRFSHATRVVHRTAKERQPTKTPKKKRAAHTQTETMGSPPKFNIKKVKKRKEEGSPRQKERDELLRSKEARIATAERTARSAWCSILALRAEERQAWHPPAMRRTGSSARRKP